MLWITFVRSKTSTFLCLVESGTCVFLRLKKFELTKKWFCFNSKCNSLFLLDLMERFEANGIQWVKLNVARDNDKTKIQFNFCSVFWAHKISKCVAYKMIKQKVHIKYFTRFKIIIRIHLFYFLFLRLNFMHCSGFFF